jgi:hypothetical protein
VSAVVLGVVAGPLGERFQLLLESQSPVLAVFQVNATMTHLSFYAFPIQESQK